MAQELHVLVTAHHAGNFPYLARLSTVIKEVRGQLVPAPVLLIDAGKAWSADSWLCTATENRAPYLVMDAMGYDMLFEAGLTAENREKLAQMMQTQLIPADQTATISHDGIDLQIRVDASQSEPQLAGNCLRLIHPPFGTLQHLHLNLDSRIIHASNWLPIAPTTRLDPTIVGTIEFVESEARYYQKRLFGISRGKPEM